MQGICVRGNTEHGAGQVKGNRVDASGICTASELKQFLTRGYRKDTNNSALIARSGHHCTIEIKGDAAKRCFVGLDNVDGLKVDCVEDK